MAGLAFDAGMHQHEATGAVSVFHLTRAETALAEQGALLVARHTANGQSRAQPFGLCVSKETGRGLYPGQNPVRDIEQFQQLRVPVVGVYVEQHSARGIADIGGVHRAAA